MKFLWRLYAVYALVVLASTLSVGAVVARELERDALAEMAGDLRVRAALLADLARPTLEGRGDALQPALGRLGRDLETRFTVIREDGRVLADSHEEPARTDDHAHRPEVEQARARGLGRATRHSATLGEPLMYVAARVDGAGGGPLGYARAALPVKVVDARLERLRLLVLVGAAAATLLALAPGWLVARRMSRPLSTMADMARSIADGTYTPELAARLPQDELGALGRAFDAVAAQLRERMETISGDRNKLAAILASMVEGVVAIDREERIVHMNEVAARLLATDAGAALGKRLGEVTRVDEVRAALTGALVADGPTVVEVRLRRGPAGEQVGREQVLELHAAPLRADDGAPTGAVVVLDDVTELRRLETLRREFVANVSHELKTPLTAICGLTETMIEDEAMDGDTSRRFLAKIQKQAERLSTLVRDLLTLSRVESEEGSLERSILDLREPVRDSFKGLQAQGEAKGRALELEVPDQPVVVSGDRELLRQVVDNLLDNAIKYSREGGRVWVRLRADEAHATVEVQDTGIGIAPRDQPRVFERFYRVDKARSREVGGTGLGLSIVKHITLAHEGVVSVESVLGEGTTFRVKVPLAPRGAADEARLPAAAAG